MRRLALVYVCVALWAAIAYGQRLPDTAAPDNYRLTFTPDFAKDNFTGQEEIKIRVLKPTSQLVLNAADIESASRSRVVSAAPISIEPRVRSPAPLVCTTCVHSCANNRRP